MSLISIPLFRGNNTETLEAIDAYAVSSDRPINKIYNSLRQGASKIWDHGAGAEKIVNGIERIYDAKDRGVKGLDLLNEGLGVFNNSTSAILRNAGTDILNKAGEFLDLDPGIVDRIKYAGEDIVRRVQYDNLGDLSSYRNIVELMGDLSGNPQLANIVNVGYEAAVWGATFTESNRFGISTYRHSRQSIDPEVYRLAVIYSIPSVSATGRLEAVKELLDVIDGDTVKGYQNDFVARFLTRYTLPTPPPANMTVHANDIVATLEQVDSKWHSHTLYTGEEVFDLTSMARMSPDAYKVLCLHGVIGKAVQISPDFHSRSIRELMLKQFPRMVLPK